MKSSSSVLLLAFAGTISAFTACAKAPSVDTTDMAAPRAPTKTVDPTEPAPENPAPLPPSNGPVSGGGTDGGSTGTSDDGAASDGGSCARTPPSNVCGLSPQCGCAAGQTCEVTDSMGGGVSCVDAGDAALGAACTATSDCAVGLTCTRGACRPYCASPGEACGGDGGSKCIASRDSGGTAITNANVCTIPCELLTPSAACGHNACIWNASLGLTDCNVAGKKVAHDACTKSEECAPGLACASHPVFGSRCARWCRVGHDDDCEAPEMCVNLAGSSAPTQGEDPIGYCE